LAIKAKVEVVGGGHTVAAAGMEGKTAARAKVRFCKKKKGTQRTSMTALRDQPIRWKLKSDVVDLA